MCTRRLLPALGLAPILIAAMPASAHAQKVEVGAPLVNVNAIVGDDSAVIIGLPTAPFGLLNPGLYVSFFAGPRVAVEGQIGLIVVSDEGETNHLLNAAFQFDYFLRDPAGHAPYVFGFAGTISVSGPGDTPNLFGAGLGYRMRLGDRLTMRLDGRYTRYTSADNGDLNTVSFTISIGGLFGR
jgi:hypothetical protein